MDFGISDVFQLDIPTVHKASLSTERELLTFSTGPLSFQGETTGLVVAGRTDGGVSFWRTKERKIKFNKCYHKETLFQTKEYHLGPVTALAYSNDRPVITFGRTGVLFSGSSDRSIKVWDVWADKAVSETCLQTMVGHGATVTSIIDSRLGFIISCSLDGSVRVWRPKIEQNTAQLSRFVNFLCCQTINLSTSVPKIGLTCMDLSLPISSRNRWALFVGDSSGTITYFRDRPSQEEPLKVQKALHDIHTLSISDLFFIDEHSFLVSVSFDCTCAIMDAVTGTVCFKINNGSNHRFCGLLWDTVADQLLLSDSAGMLTKWSAFSKQTVGKVALETPPLQHYIEGVNPLPDLSGLSWMYGQCNNLIVCLPKHSIFQQYDIIRESKRSEFFGHMDMVVGCYPFLASATQQFDFDAERVMVSASADNTIRVWDCVTRLERYNLCEPSNSEIACMIFVPALRLLVTGNQDGSMRWWHPDTGPLLHRCGHDNTVSALCFASVSSLHHSVEEHYLVSCSFDGSIGIWLFFDHGHTELSPLRHERLIAAHGMSSNGTPNEVLCVCFHKQSQLIVSGGNDSQVRCWSASDRQLRLVLSGHEDAVTCVCVETDGPFLFTGSDDGRIIVWDLGTSRMKDGPRSSLLDGPVAVLAGKAALRALLVIPTNPPLLVSATGDSIIKVWDFTRPSPVDPTLLDQHSIDPTFDDAERQASQQGVDENSEDNVPVVEVIEEVVKEVYEISVDDDVSEPSCLGFLEIPSPPLGDPITGVVQQGKVSVNVLIGMTSGTVIKISLPGSLA